MTDFQLSIVIIAKNEEKNIGRCIASAIEASKDIQNTEIILVDSLSQDNTIKIAKRYPIKIFQLLPGQRITSWSARFAGTICAQGDLIQFLDGDMVIHKNWFAQALPYLSTNEKIAGVFGFLNEIYVADNHIIGRVDNILQINAKVVENPRLIGGAILVKKKILDKIGTFNPFLYGDGEAELCYRIGLDGLKILAIAAEMADHYSNHRYSWSDIKRRCKSNLYIGFGQVLRYHYKKPTVYKLLIRRRQYFPPLVFFLFGVPMGIIYFYNRSFLPLLVWVLLFNFYFLILVLRYKSFKEAVFNIISKALYSYGMIRGFFLKPFQPSCYPKRFNQIN